jgi:hypothetical protein
MSVPSLNRGGERAPPRSWTHFTDASDVVLAEEQPSIGCADDRAHAAVTRRDIVFADQRSVGSHSSDLVGGVLREPEIAVGARRDAAE